MTGKLVLLALSLLAIALPVYAETPPQLTITSGAPCVDPPVSCRVSSKFGFRFHPTLRVWRLHKGMDFACPTGTEIKAAFDGVAAGGYSSCGGNLASLSNGNVMLKQWHQSTVFIPNGPDQKNVRKGDLISLSGNTGTCTTGAHLHFEYWINGKPENPLAHYCSGASQDAGQDAGAGDDSHGDQSQSLPDGAQPPEGAVFQDNQDIDLENASITEQLLLASESRFSNPRWYAYLLNSSSEEGLLREIAYMKSLHNWAGYQQLQMRERILVGLADLQQLKNKRNQMKAQERKNNTK